MTTSHIAPSLNRLKYISKPQKNSNQELNTLNEQQNHPDFSHDIRAHSYLGLVYSNLGGGWGLERKLHVSLFIFWWKNIFMEVAGLDLKKIQTLSNNSVLKKNWENITSISSK